MKDLAGLQAALDEMTEPLVVTGVVKPIAPVSLHLPDGTELSLADPEALAPHTEPAPYGDGRLTRTDPKVRRGLRIKARGAVEVRGFAPAILLDEIERAISPREHLAATLLDVHVYPPGGHFLAHIDTPRSPETVGSLVVALPSAHAGGALAVRSGELIEKYDWGSAADGTLHWAAFYGDIEHAVEPVERGYRITLAYTLSERGAPRTPDAERAAAVRAAFAALKSDVTIPCARRVIVPRDGAGAIAPNQLRGGDREIAEAARDLAIPFEIVACLAVLDERDAKLFPAQVYPGSLTALDKPLTDVEIGKLGDMVTYAKRATTDEDELTTGTLAKQMKRDGRSYDVTSLHDRVGAPEGEWVWRKRARATLIHETMFSESGSFGNEAIESMMYTLAAIELRVSDRGKQPEPPPPPAPNKRARHPKFGDGDVIAVLSGGDILEIKFDDGVTRKLIAKLVTRIA